MDEHARSVDQRRRDEGRLFRRALLVSVLVHVLILIFGPVGSVLIAPFSAAGPRAEGARAAAGGMQALNVLAPPREPIVPPPEPILVDVEVEPIEFDEKPEVDPASLLGHNPGELLGPGVDEGTGDGDGGTTEAGRFRLQPPSPRGMIIPPTNEKLKGRQVEVWLFVDARGRVVPDSTQLRPPTSDRSFNRRLIQEAAEWVFRPALRGGEPVATWFSYSISM